MNWLGALLLALLEWLTKQAEKPRTMTDVKTPDSILNRWRDSLRERLRDKDGGN